MIETVYLPLPNNYTAQVAILSEEDDPSEIPQALGLQCSQRVLVVIGGASNLDDTTALRLRQLFQKAIAPLADDLDLLVIDGGTDAGVIRLMGQARQAINGKFNLLGIAPVGKISLPDERVASKKGHALEANHTHFILVPGNQWGDESAWLARFAVLFSGQQPATVVLINGGSISFIDLQENLLLGQSAVVIAGSGRLADSIADAITHPEESHTLEVEQLIQKAGKQLFVFDLSKPLDDFVELIQHLMEITT